MNRGWSEGWFFKHDTMNTLVFLTFNFILLTVDHWLTLSISCCIVDESISFVITTSETAQSSTYLYIGNSAVKSLTITRKKRGPNLVPWGTPALILLHLDLQAPNLTRCCLSWRKLAHQFKSTGGTLSNCSLCNRMLWSILSKALEKSVRQDRDNFISYWEEYYWHFITIKRSIRGIFYEYNQLRPCMQLRKMQHQAWCKCQYYS